MARFILGSSPLGRPMPNVASPKSPPGPELSSSCPWRLSTAGPSRWRREIDAAGSSRRHWFDASAKKGQQKGSTRSKKCIWIKTREHKPSYHPIKTAQRWQILVSYIYIHTYTYIYIHIHTYILTLHYITLRYVTLHYITLHTIHTYTHIHIHIHIHTYIHTHTYTYIHTYRQTYIYIHIHTHTYIHTYIHACMHACIHTYTYTYTYTYIYIYIYIHIHTYWWFQPLWKICQLGLLFPIYAKIKNVPKHQPVYIHIYTHIYNYNCICMDMIQW